MRYIAIKDNKITNIIASSQPFEKVKEVYQNADDLIEVRRDAPVQKGKDIRYYNSNWDLKSEAEILQELNISSLGENERIVFEDAEGWKIITSYKGKEIYNKENYLEFKICDEDDIPEGYTLKKPLENKPSKFVNDEWVLDFEVLKDRKKSEIKTLFEENLQHGSFFSEALQIQVDCRRNDISNDKQNVDGLISIMLDRGIETTYYKGDGATATDVTIEQLKALSKEMEFHVFNLYQTKHTLMTLVDQVSDNDEIALNNIKWS